ncbi:MAG TPA: sigma-70 family RNA polymerase sigma factor [Pseudomonadales bacterium]
MADADDDELMARVQRRDQAAFGRLVDRHLDGVHRYLVRLTASMADADELAQETFLRLWERADSYRPGRVQLSTWLHRIAHNLAVDELRRRRPQTDETELQAAPDEANPEHQAAARETGRRLDRALARLPETQRAALLLCQVQGFSNRDAAEIIGVSVRGLESLIARARRSLRDALQDDLEYDPTRGSNG